MTVDAKHLRRARRAVYGPPVMGAIGAIMALVGAFGLESTDGASKTERTSESPSNDLPLQFQPPTTLTSGRGGFFVVTADAQVYRSQDLAHAAKLPFLAPGEHVVAGAEAPNDGYWLVTEGGKVLAVAAPPYGELPKKPAHGPVVGIAPFAGGGYWLTTADGHVYGFGAARNEGDLAHAKHRRPVVAIAAEPHGSGYWLLTSDGAVHAFGGAPNKGDLAHAKHRRPVVAIAAEPHGSGYWLLTSDGAVHAFRTLSYGGLERTRPRPNVVSIAAAPDGGYWVATADGTVGNFGPAPRFGSLDKRSLREPVVAIIPY
jgi:hypothetical protein